MLLYHGSNQVVETPLLIEQTRGLDFGAGFYLTTEEKQAIQFSQIIVNRRKYGIATVSVYDFDMETVEEKATEGTFSILRFRNADVDWLRFVTENRLKTYSGKLYDMVIGAVANDAVMPTIQAFLGGFLNEEAAIITLKASRLTDQVCLKSEQALSFLRFVRSYETLTKGGDE